MEKTKKSNFFMVKHFYKFIINIKSCVVFKKKQYIFH
jgi:hypothetical protein